MALYGCGVTDALPYDESIARSSHAFSCTCFIHHASALPTLALCPLRQARYSVGCERLCGGGERVVWRDGEYPFDFTQ